MAHLRFTASLLLASWLARVDAFNYVARYVNATTTENPSPSTLGPYIAGFHYTWSQYIVPTVVGTVRVTVNQANNRTWSTTVYHTDFERNGSRTLLTRTDTNAAGTVTADVHGWGDKTNVTVAYPTTVLDFAPSMTWASMTTITTTGPHQQVNVCSGEGTTKLCTGDDTITDLGPKGPLNTADPSGWLYTLVGWNYFARETYLSPAQVSSYWSPQTLGIGGDLDSCGYTYCGYTAPDSAGPAAAVQSQAYLLATESTTISSASATPTSSSAASSASSVDVAAPQATAAPDQASPTASSSLSSETPTPSAKSSADAASETPAKSTPPTDSSTAVAPVESTTKSPAEVSAAGSSSPGPVDSQKESASAEPHSAASSSTPKQSTSQFVVGSQTLNVGSSITVGSGSSTTVVALRTSESKTILQVGSLTSTLSKSKVTEAASSPTAVALGGVTVSHGSSSEIVIGTQTLSPGSSITVGSGSSTTVVALQTSGSETVLQVGTLTSALPRKPTPESAASPTPVVVGGVTAVTGSSGALVVGSQTLTPGASITVGSGKSTTVVALQTTGSETVLQAGTSKTTLPANTGTAPSNVVLGGVTLQPASSPTTPSNVVLGGVTLQSTSSLEYVVGSETLAPGASITVGSGSSTTVIALLTSGSNTVLEVGTSKTTLPAAGQSTSVITLNGITLSPTSNADIIVGSQTLAPGSSITIGSGSSTTVVALETSGSQTVLEVGSSKTTLTGSAISSTSSAASSTDIGGYVASGIGGGGQPSSSSTSTTVTQSNDAAALPRSSGLVVFMCFLFGLAVI